MSAEIPWHIFEQTLRDPWTLAAQWKQQTGGPVIGHLLPDVPEELIHAAGALPVALTGAGVRAARAHSLIPGYTCSHVMGILERALTGELEILDGVVIPYVCDTTRNLHHIWRRAFPETWCEFLRLPKRLEHPGARDYLREEFSRMREALSRQTHGAATDEALEESFRLYNKSRAKLREAYERHRKDPGTWSTGRLQAIVASAQCAPREVHLQWMERLPWNEDAHEPTSPRIPLYVRGKLWDPPELLGILDELGFVIVGDEIVTGYRSVGEDVHIRGDPLEALVERHMRLIPYAGYHMPPREVVDGFLRRVEQSGAAGVLILEPKFCEVAGFDSPDLQQGLRRLRVPFLALETSPRGGAAGALRVRLEAFAEMLSRTVP